MPGTFLSSLENPVSGGTLPWLVGQALHLQQLPVFPVEKVNPAKSECFFGALLFGWNHQRQLLEYFSLMALHHFILYILDLLLLKQQRQEQELHWDHALFSNATDDNSCNNFRSVSATSKMLKSQLPVRWTEGSMKRWNLLLKDKLQVQSVLLPRHCKSVEKKWCINSWVLNDKEQRVEEWCDFKNRE